MRNTLLKWALLTLLLAYTAFMTVWASDRERRQPCRGVDVEVEGCRPELQTTVRRGVLTHLGALTRVEGVPVGSLDLRRMERWLGRLENLEEASCAVTPNGRLRVRVRALVPEMRVFGPGGESYYVNREGKRMASRAEFFADVPVVTGRFGPGFRETALIPLLRGIDRDSLLRHMVTMVEVRSPADIILVPRVSGHVVNLGDTSRLAEKLAALGVFYRKVMPARGWNRYTEVSLKFRGQAIGVLRDKPVPAPADTVAGTDPEEQALAASGVETPEYPRRQPAPPPPARQRP